MEKFELEQSLKDEIRFRVAGAGFMKIVQTVRRNGKLFIGFQIHHNKVGTFFI